MLDNDQSLSHEGHGKRIKGNAKWVLSAEKDTQYNMQSLNHPKGTRQGNQNLFVEQNARVGARRIQKDLEEAGMPCGLKTIASSMKRQSLVPKASRKFKVTTTDSKHNLPIAPNLLKRDFSATKSNEK